MKKNRQGFALLGIVGMMFFSACTGIVNEVKDVSILPLPNNIVQKDSYFILPGNCSIGIADKRLEPAAKYLVSILSQSTGYEFKVVEGEGDITLTLSDVKGVKGAYSLVSSKKSVTITANDYAGVIYGIESLRQLLPARIESKQKVADLEWTVPAVEITDAPTYQWRGLMLDVSRHFYDKEEVKELLDLMALYKMNKFHWHLTDDQGWRIQIKKYPLLTEKGAWRKFNSQDRGCMSLAVKEDNTDYLIPVEKLKIIEGDTLYGGYYTQEDIKEIVAYAGVRGIDIVPEIDMPGHMLAAVGNYNGVSCFRNTGWGKTFSSPVCPGKDSALEFCKNVYSEIISLFPYEYVHIGGDEVEKSNWKKCPDCQTRMRVNKLQTEEQLQSWFIHEMEAFFNSKGRKMIGWDEILEGGLSKTATVMWWRSWAKDVPQKTTQQGNKIIFTPNTAFYLDYKQDSKSLTNIYNYDMVKDFKDQELVKNVQGVQGNIWCEWIPSKERLFYMAAPRMQAIAELGWSDPAQKNWDNFKERLICQLDRMNQMKINYRIPDLEGFHKTNVFLNESEVNIDCMDPHAKIRYTTDGTNPTAQSPEYRKGMKVSETTRFVFRTFRENGKPGDMFKTDYVKEQYLPAADVVPTEKGLKAVWYDFSGSKCADIVKAAKKGEYKVSDISIPKEVNGHIGLVISGYIKIPVDGIYTFVLTSDDGSVLTIDDKVVIDNDGPHSPREIISQKALSKGFHPINVRYFDSNGGLLTMQVKNASGKILTPEDLYLH